MACSEHSLTVKALAKINLTLEITDLLPKGYHRLDTIFQALELADTLTLEKAEASSLQIIDNIGSGFTVSSTPDNLVFKAQKALEALLERELPCRFTLNKYIPAGGGLGGGSADCAAALKGLNKLYNLNLSFETLHRTAASLGADAAFGLFEGTARGLGKGDELTALPSPKYMQDWGVILLIPSFGLSTPEVYKAWDTMDEEVRRPAASSSQKLADLLNSQEREAKRFCSLLANDLYPAAAKLQPELQQCLDELIKFGCSQSLLCGSGSTVFGLINPESAEAINADPSLLSALKPFGKAVITKFALK